MTKYEYKTVTLVQKRWGWWQSRTIPEIPYLDSTLNREGRDGWRLCEIVLPSAAFGAPNKVIVIFERVLERAEN